MADNDKIRRAAKMLGSRGGVVGGPARAKKMSSRERSAIAAKGGRASQSRKGA